MKVYEKNIRDTYDRYKAGCTSKRRLNTLNISYINFSHSVSEHAKHKITKKIYTVFNLCVFFKKSTFLKSNQLFNVPIFMNYGICFALKNVGNVEKLKKSTYSVVSTFTFYCIR